MTIHVAVRPIDPEELADMRATPERLAALVDESDGSIKWLADGTPSVPRCRRTRHLGTRLDRAAAQRAPSGYRRLAGAAAAAVLALLLLLGTLGFAWYREGR